MPDYGHEIEFGYFLVPDAGDPDGVLETARLVGPPDHWADVLTHLAIDFGFGTFALLAPPDPEILADVHGGRRPTSPRARRDGARA